MVKRKELDLNFAPPRKVSPITGLEFSDGNWVCTATEIRFRDQN